ncbi:MAG: BFO_1060 family glycosyltransferase [Cytophagaceae bacterium]
MSLNRKYRILCYTDNDSGRDVEMVLPLRFFAEKFLNCEFIHAFVYDVYAIYSEKPDLVLLPNTVGSPLYFEISRYAAQQGIKVFALTSEGNFRTDGTFNYWGYNTDKIFYQEYICLWSSRTRDFLVSQHPELEDKIVLTGGTGFDRYKIYDFLTREEYVKIKKLRAYKKVIGYAGWAFGKLYNKQGLEELLFFFKYDHSRLTWLEEQRVQVEGMLKQLIEDNPDTLFILKKHPNENNPSIITEGLNEMNRLTDYPNVLYIRDEDNIHDLIHVSDVWLGFESTTAIEAWMMGKQTLLLNPDPDFNRDRIYKGSVIARNYAELKNEIDIFYKAGKLTSFYIEDKEKERAAIISDTIGYGDGLNHIRAGCYLQRVLESITEEGLKERSYKFSLKFFTMRMLMRGGSFFYHKKLFSKLYKFKKTIWIFDRFRLPMIQVLFQKISPALERFYKANQIEEKFKNNALCREIVKK